MIIFILTNIFQLSVSNFNISIKFSTLIFQLINFKLIFNFIFELTIFQVINSTVLQIIFLLEVSESWFNWNLSN